MKTALSASLFSLILASSPLAVSGGQTEKAWAEGAAFESSLLAVRGSFQAQALPLSRGPMDVFQELDACQGVDSRFLIQPRLSDAVRMIEPCMDALSYRYGISLRAEAREGIAIVVKGMVASTRVIDELEDSLALREGRLLTYPAVLLDRTSLRESSLQPVVESCVGVPAHAEVRTAGDFIQVYGGCLRSAEAFSIDSIRTLQERGRGRAVVYSRAGRDTLSSMNGKVSVPGPEGAVDIEIRAVSAPLPRTF